MYFNVVQIRNTNAACLTQHGELHRFVSHEPNANYTTLYYDWRIPPTEIAICCSFKIKLANKIVRQIDFCHIVQFQLNILCQCASLPQNNVQIPAFVGMTWFLTISVRLWMKRNPVCHHTSLSAEQAAEFRNLFTSGKYAHQHIKYFENKSILFDFFSSDLQMEFNTPIFFSFMALMEFNMPYSFSSDLQIEFNIYIFFFPFDRLGLNIPYLFSFV